MIINYFDKYEIDTDTLKDKIDIIKKSNTENSMYLAYIFENTIEYLFNDVELNLNKLTNKIKNTSDLFLYFDTIKNINDISFSANRKILIIGNHNNQKIDEKIELINISEISKIIKMVKTFSTISIGVNLDSINFEKYYYGRMRSYFLHVANSLSNISIESLKENTEKEVNNIMFAKSNFNIEYNIPHEAIELKDIMNIYSKVLNATNYEIDDNFYYTSKNKMNLKTKLLLNELEVLIKLFNIRDKEQRANYIYDYICEEMMKEIKSLNYCKFENNKCVTSRYAKKFPKGFPKSKANGCCANTYLDKRKNCRYLNSDYSCKICSISCRIFTCKYLQDRGIDHSLWQYPIIDCSMGKMTRAQIIHSFFTPKDVMIKRIYKGIR